MNKTRKIISIILTLAMVLCSIPVAVSAEECCHVDANKDNFCDNCSKELYIERNWDDTKKKVVEILKEIPTDAVRCFKGIGDFTAGKTYVFDGTVGCTSPTIRGTTDKPTVFILKDGSKLKTSCGISFNDSNALIICGQAADSGIIEATGIVSGGINTERGSTVTIDGGTIIVKGRGPIPGINGTVTINGGNITAGDLDSPGIQGLAKDIVTINGGTITTTGDLSSTVKGVLTINGTPVIEKVTSDDIEYTYIHYHKFIYTDNGDGTHTGSCACGAVNPEKEEHTFVGGVCVCGAKACEVTSVKELTTPVVGEYVTLEITAVKPVKKLQFVDADGNTYTYSEASTHTLGVVDNDDGTQVWTVEIKVRENSEDFEILARTYENGWSDKSLSYTLDIDAAEFEPSVEVPDLTSGMLEIGKHDVIIKTAADVTKVQFVYNGNTATYSKSNSSATVEEGDGCLIWTISKNFCSTDDGTYIIKTRTATTSFEDSGLSFTVDVVKEINLL